MVVKRWPLQPRMPRILWGRRSFGFHARQKPQVFDERGVDMNGRIRALILREQLAGPDHEPQLRETLRKRLGREPTRREMRAALAKRYRGAKQARKRAARAAA